MNVYMAGKIRLEDWRTELVPNVYGTCGVQGLSWTMLGKPHYAVMAYQSDTLEDYLNGVGWPAHYIERAPGWIYVGPYFCDIGHGWEYADGWHGWENDLNVPDGGPDEETGAYDSFLEDRAACRALVHELNSMAIRDCDALVAWLDADDCYGTLVEIGYAARDKLIGIVTNDLAHFQEEHWFALQYAHTVVNAANPVDGVLEALSRLEDEARRRSIARLRAMPYREYLETEWWQTVRAGAMDRAGHRCQLCGANGTTQLNVHHNSYENRGAEQPHDLVVLCRACHSKHHDRTR